jgi:hypothetical protein
MGKKRKTRQGITRRRFLQQAGGGAIALGLASSPVLKAFGADAKQDLVVAYDASDAFGWDPQAMALPTPDKTVASSLYNGLLKWPDGVADLTKLEPDLAESWEVSPDGIEWKFKLKEGVKWHTVFGEDFGEFNAQVERDHASGVSFPDPEGCQSDGALYLHPIPHGRPNADTVLPLAIHCRHGDGGDQFFALYRHRQPAGYGTERNGSW